MPDHPVDGTNPEMDAAIAGDPGARNAIWRRHRRWLAAILLAHKPREIDIEDLMQEVAVKFVSKLHTLRDPSAFKPWLRRIALNAAREAARGVNVRRRQITDADEGQLPGRPNGVGSMTDSLTRDEAHGVLKHVMTLPPDFREPLLLQTVQGLGCKQIAEILELPVTTVETRLSRARRMLREEWRARLNTETGRTPEAKRRLAPTQT
ncbi:MAG: RNA polymerase sigma factor [Phycisphaerales bacterium]